MESLVLKGLFGGVYEGLKVLVTGHTGFKGSWLCLWLTQLGARVCGLALPPDTSPAHWNLLQLGEVLDMRVDLRDATTVQKAVRELQPDIVFHLAAQALVRRSYREPLATFETNVLGLVHLLEATRACPSIRAIVNATTDKVYREQPVKAGYREDDPVGGHDPYSTSKACAELISACYRQSFLTGAQPEGTRSATARAGNVIGGGDWSEDRLVPDVVRAVAKREPLRIRNPDAIRPWQHVLEPLSGYLLLGQGLLQGDAVEGAWNFGPDPAAMLPVKTLVARMQAHWPDLRNEAHPGPHPHEAETLLLDSSRAARELGWRSVWDAETTLQRTVRWYRSYYEGNSLLSHDDLSTYVDEARQIDLRWAP
jgi:CDP-glucose 4,6-dehydratase